MQNAWVSIRRLKTQEFFKTLRYIQNGGATWHDIYLRLGELQEKSGKAFLKSLYPLVVSYLLLMSLADAERVSITFQGITASIPTAYVTLMSSLLVFLSFQHLQSTIMIINIRSTESVKLRLYRFSANSYGLYHGQDDMALSVPVLQSFFLKDKLGVSKALSLLTLATYSLILLPLASYYLYLIKMQLNLLIQDKIILVERFAAILGVSVLLFSAVFLILFNIPLPFQKDKNGIRWGFLCHLHPTGMHPQLGKWLDGLKSKP